MTDHRNTAEAIFRHALRAVDPFTLVKNSIRIEGKTLHIVRQAFELEQLGRIYVIGAGKAAAPMAQAAETILGSHITAGVIITKYGHGLPLQYIQVIEAAHPLPDASGLQGTQAILSILSQTRENDLVIVLLSGGGSSLLADVPPDCTLTELQNGMEAQLHSGADIEEMNTVRKHLSAVKGGQLARAAYPARMVTLILSDVVGDNLSVIASGPTVADPTTFGDAWDIILKYNLTEKIPDAILRHLQSGKAGHIPETPKPGDPVWNNVSNELIGSNQLALQAARKKAEALGFYTQILTDQMTGEAHNVALNLLEQAKIIASDKQNPRPVCLLAGGETTVTVCGNGLGGRNQELALVAAIALEHQPGITLLAAGTDGTDGPTDATGAVVDARTLLTAKSKGMDASDFLSRNDSYHFFQHVGGHLLTGSTQTNVMDLVIILIA